MPLHRRAFLASSAAAFTWLSAIGAEAEGIASIEPGGVLIGDCTVPGETRADDVVPAHPNGLPVSRDRWLLVYATRGFRGVDDDRSIIYQLRHGAPDGRVLKEGLLGRAHAGWDPLGDGKPCFKQLGHPVAFGVPKGALVRGRPAANANVFVAKWRVVGRRFDPEKNTLAHSGADPELRRRTQGVEWVQFRLNEREDDIHILAPVARLRQRGFEQGPRFCAVDVGWMNQTFTPPVPFGPDGLSWADVNHFDGGRIAALKYVYNPKRGLYEWAELGPFLGGEQLGLTEASLARGEDEWVIAARLGTGRGVAWARARDPFAAAPRPTVTPEPAINAPLTLFHCADGRLRLFSGDATASPRRNARDPLYCWGVDPERDFACTGRRVVFDSERAGLRLRRESGPKVDMCKLLPPQGRSQLAIFRVSVRSYNQPYVGGSGQPTDIPVVNAAEKMSCGIYFARILYRKAAAGPWEFAAAPDAK